MAAISPAVNQTPVLNNTSVEPKTSAFDDKKALLLKEEAAAAAAAAAAAVVSTSAEKLPETAVKV